MKIELMGVLQTVVMVIVAFLGAVIITKTLSKWLQWDKKQEEISQEEE